MAVFTWLECLQQSQNKAPAEHLFQGLDNVDPQAAALTLYLEEEIHSVDADTLQCILDLNSIVLWHKMVDTGLCCHSQLYAQEEKLVYNTDFKNSPLTITMIETHVL